jgi:serine/threonine protein kinase
MPAALTSPHTSPTLALAKVTGSSDEAPSLLHSLLDSSIILGEDWKALGELKRTELIRCPERGTLLTLAVKYGLLTEFQAGHIAAGTTFGLILGNYRVLERLGAGGMAVVFKAEHIIMRRVVAIKVLPLSANEDPKLLQRFFREMRSAARLMHPNIVSALDAGTLVTPDPNSPRLHYFVMEYVPGQDLAELVNGHGPLAPSKACGLAYQVASALAALSKHHLVHRDIKPSNVLVTPEGQAKLLDFGLARRLQSKSRSVITEPGQVLGTLDYIAPEQAEDPTAVDIRADIYGLGGTLFWCLAGRSPFPSRRHIAQHLADRLTKPPPSLRSFQPGIPAELDAAVTRMLLADRDARYESPEAVMKALLPFTNLNPRPADRPASCAEVFPVGHRDAPPDGNGASADRDEIADLKRQLSAAQAELRRCRELWKAVQNCAAQLEQSTREIPG